MDSVLFSSSSLLSLCLGLNLCFGLGLRKNREEDINKGRNEERKKGAKYLPQKCYKKEQFISEKYATGVLTQIASLETK